MANNHSAEWLRGAIEALDRARRDFTVTVPELQAEYVALLAAAEAREADQPTAEEVIAACKVALERLMFASNTIEVLGEYEALEINTSSRRTMRAKVDKIMEECHSTVSKIAAWEAAQRG